NDSLILTRNIATTEELQRLGNKLNIDAFLFGEIILDKVTRELHLNLKFVEAKTGKILKIGTLIGHDSKSRIFWSIEASQSGNFSMSGPIHHKGKSGEEYKSSITRGKILLPDYYEFQLGKRKQALVYRLIDNALLKLPDFIIQIPKEIKKIALSSIEKTQLYNLSTIKLKQSLTDRLLALKRFKVIDCPNCSKKVVTLDKEKIVVGSILDQPEQLKQLFDKQGIEAVLQGNITVDFKKKFVSLGLQLIDTKTGKVIHAQTLHGIQAKGMVNWTIDLVKSTGFLVHGQLTNPENHQSHEGTILTPTMISGELKLPVINNNSDLKHTSIDLDHMIQSASKKIPDFLSGLPSNLKRISVGRIEGDHRIYSNPRKVRYFLKQSIVKGGSANLIECITCQSKNYIVTKYGLIPQQNIQKTQDLQELAKRQKFDALILGFTELDEDKGTLKLFLHVVDAKDGKIVHSGILEGKSKVVVQSKNSEFSIAISPYVSGFLYKLTTTDPNTSAVTYTEDRKFMAANLRYLFGTFAKSIKLGISIDYFENVLAETQQNKLNVVLASGLLQYSFPWKIGQKRALSLYLGGGLAMAKIYSSSYVQSSNFNAGLELKVSQNLAIGLNYYSISNIDLENSDLGMVGTFEASSATSVSARFSF
ncbi:MAG: hypothetical protein ACI86H_002964, partial [bacterium]